MDSDVSTNIDVEVPQQRVVRGGRVIVNHPPPKINWLHYFIILVGLVGSSVLLYYSTEYRAKSRLRKCDNCTLGYNITTNEICTNGNLTYRVVCEWEEIQPYFSGAPAMTFFGGFILMGSVLLCCLRYTSDRGNGLCKFK